MGIERRKGEGGKVLPRENNVYPATKLPDGVSFPLPPSPFRLQNNVYVRSAVLHSQAIAVYGCLLFVLLSRVDGRRRTPVGNSIGGCRRCGGYLAGRVRTFFPGGVGVLFGSQGPSLEAQKRVTIRQ